MLVINTFPNSMKYHSSFGASDLYIDPKTSFKATT